MMMTTSSCTAPACCGRCREWVPMRMTTTRIGPDQALGTTHAGRHRSRLSAQSPHRHRAGVPDRGTWRCRAAVRRVSMCFRISRRRMCLLQTEAPGLDATQVEALVTRPLEGSAGGHGEREDRTLHVEPRPLGDASGIRSRRRSVPPASSRYGAFGGIRRLACRRVSALRCSRR